MLAGFLAGCGNGGDSSSSQTFPSSATVFYMHSVAFRNSTTMAWGYNAFGQLGDDSTTERTEPKFTGLFGMTGMSVGSNHSLAFMNNSTVRAWGYNGYGQLGNSDSNFESKKVPVKVSNISGVIAVAAGGFHSLALDKDNNVWAWGSNSNGRLGIGTTDNSNYPQQVTTTNTGGAFTNITSIAAGGSHSVALKSDGTVWTWGYNGNGQLGDGSTADRYKPVQVYINATTTLTDVKLIAAGGAFTVAVDNSNNIWAWGYNGYGQLGQNPTTTTTSNYAVQVTGVTGTIVAISAGADHVLALTSIGELWVWGLNRYGQLGDGLTTDRYVPYKIPSFVVDVTRTVDGVNPVAAIGLHSLARKNNGKLWSWGYNAYGQLGDMSKTDRYTPVQVTGY